MVQVTDSHITKLSDADIEITNKIKEACKLLDVHFFDHIIISHLGYYRFAENKVC